MLAALCGYPQGTFAAELREDGQAIVTREIDGGLQIVSLTLPAIITTDLRLNQPRYTSLPNMMVKPLTITMVSSALNYARIRRCYGSRPAVRGRRACQRR